MVKYLCVAEKPSISKSITQILSGGRFESRGARSPAWIKNYDFSYRLPQHGPGWTDFTVTAVAGHLMASDFNEQYKGWRSCDPFDLFDAPIEHFVSPDPNHRGIAANLTTEAKKATHLMIWTDCDREGEYIGSEVAEVCRKANPRIIVKRARFSAIIAAQINNACRNAIDLDMRQVNAVAARMDLDLRVGAALTRTQTLGLQNVFAALADKIISYGPCQFPTLGFVVDQYERVQAFIPEPFWSIHVAIQREDSTTSFGWARGRLFDHEVAEALFEMCQDEPEATVLSQQTKPTQKWKPLPLTTVELQKTGSRLLRMTPKQILDTSDSLYQRGILSYPRTETDIFDKDFDFMDLINKQTVDGAWGGFATALTNGGFERPRNGKKDDKAHPPIHPTSHVNNLNGDDKKVYDLVVRRFLACCSKNARGLETTVEISIASEHFTAKGLIVQERNYLDVYVYDKWAGNLLPSFDVGERFVPDICELTEGTTTRPNLLTEADLVSLMDKNGIGTDATIAEHIAKIVEREYVIKQKQGGVEHLVPSTLGIGLVEGYNAIGFDKSLSKPYLRRLTEKRMSQICEGTKTKNQVIDETLDEYREMFLKTKREFGTFVNSVKRYIEGDDDDEGDDDNDDDDDGPPAPRAGRGRGTARGRAAAAGSRGRGAGGGRGAARGAGRGTDTTARGRGRGTATARGGVFRGRGKAAGMNGRASSAKVQAGDDDDDEDDFMFEDFPDLDDDAPPARARPSSSKAKGKARADSAPTRDAPNCRCDETAAEKTVVKESANKGRQFFGCAKGMNDGCGFFEWADEDGGGGGITPQKRSSAGISNPRPAARPRQTYNSNNEDDETIRRCECDLTPVERTVTKEGPNTGRKFYVCPNTSKAAQCKYFEWADEDGPVPSTSRAMNGGGGPSATTGECFICSQPGHWSRDCPNKNDQNRNTSRAAGGSGGAAVQTCFSCGEEGHFSSACPNRGASGGGRAPARGRGRGRGRGTRGKKAYDYS